MSDARGVTAFAPATVGNVICGFDILGLALEEPGDEVTASASAEPGVRIRGISGAVEGIPLDARANSAGAAVGALLSVHAPEAGLALDVRKGLPLSAGMGGSAASAVAAVVAADALLGTGCTPEELLAFALEGERVSADQGHSDNVASSLLGGIVLVRPGGGRPFLELPVPNGMSVALLRPHLELPTREARAALEERIPLSDGVEQMSHVAAFVAGLHRTDWQLIRDALVDRIAEPRRRGRIPGFEPVREAALAAGALGAGISGAGPSLFALCRTPNEAQAAGKAMLDAFSAAAGLPADLILSKVSTRGARVRRTGARKGVGT